MVHAPKKGWFVLGLVRGFVSQRAERLILAPASGQRVGRLLRLRFAERSGTVCVAVNEGNEECFAGNTRLVEVTGLSVGRHEIRVRDADLEDRVSVHRVDEAADVFSPSFEWRNVLESQSVPAGLDIRLPLDGGQKRARIPDPFRLQVYVDQLGFWRADVAKDDTVAQLEASLNAWAHHSDDDNRKRRLSYDGETPLHPNATAEDVDLFGHQSALRLLDRE